MVEGVAVLDAVTLDVTVRLCVPVRLAVLVRVAVFVTAAVFDAVCDPVFDGVWVNVLLAVFDGV